MRGISIQDVDQALGNGTIIGRVKRIMRVLVQGHTSAGRTLNVVLAVHRAPGGGWWLDAVTAYWLSGKRKAS